jgi:hypothetical protein
MGGEGVEVPLHKFITFDNTLEMLLPERTAVPIELEAAWALKPGWTFWKTEESLAPVGI